MSENKIHQLEFNSINYFLIRCSFFGISINTILSLSKSFSYLSILLGAIIGFIPLLIYNYILHNNNDGILILNKKLFGYKLGTLLNILISLIIFIYSIIIFKNLISFINLEFLKESPKSFIYILFIVPLFFILKEKVNVISRVSLILFYISILFVIISFFSFISNYDFSLLKPTLPFQYNNISISAINFISYNIFPLFVITIIPKKEIIFKKNFKRNYILIYVFTSLILFVDTLFIISTFGVNLATLYDYPQFNLLRSISFLGFVNRIMSVFSVIWIFDIFISLVMCLYFINNTINDIFKRKSNNNKQIIILLILLFFSNNKFAYVLFSSYVFLKIFPLIMFIFFLLLPIIIAIKIKKTKNKYS